MTVSEREKKFVELRRKELMAPEVFRQVRTLMAGWPIVPRPPRVRMLTMQKYASRIAAYAFRSTNPTTPS